VAPPWKLPDKQVLQTKMSHARTVVEILDGFREAAGVSRGKWLAQYGTPSATDDVWGSGGAAFMTIQARHRAEKAFPPRPDRLPGRVDETQSGSHVRRMIDQSMRYVRLPL
jgi:hypothetical protein